MAPNSDVSSNMLARDLIDTLSEHADLAGVTEDGRAILHLALPIELFERWCEFCSVAE